MQQPNPLLVTSSFPDETPEMYHWRGDYGLLDRLSYGESGEIPRNWKMTSLDPAKVQARIKSGPPESTDGRLLSDQPFDDPENDQEASGSTRPESQSGTLAGSSVHDAAASSRDVPKLKRHELLIEPLIVIEDGLTKRRSCMAIINLVEAVICAVFGAAIGR